MSGCNQRIRFSDLLARRNKTRIRSITQILNLPDTQADAVSVPHPVGKTSPAPACQTARARERLNHLTSAAARLQPKKISKEHIPDAEAELRAAVDFATQAADQIMECAEDMLEVGAPSRWEIGRNCYIQRPPHSRGLRVSRFDGTANQ